MRFLQNLISSTPALQTHYKSFLFVRFENLSQSFRPILN